MSAATAARPDVARLLEAIREAGRPRLEALPLAEARKAILPFIEMQGEREPVAAAAERTLPGPGGPIAVRVYRPAGEGPLPGIVYLHGGGWVIGDLEVADRPCRRLANAAGAVVVSVDYRLAPEHPFPAAYEDARAATHWAAEHAAELDIDPARLAVGGDSAGGNLAAAVALTARAEGPPIAAQLLAYPVLDADFDTPSYRRNAEDELLPRSTMQWFWAQYGAGRDLGTDPRALPLRAGDLRAAPPAYLATCGLDPLQDEGDRYAERLRAAGVPVIWERHDGLVHGALWMTPATPSAEAVLEGMAAAARTLLRHSHATDGGGTWTSTR